jgi:hypothetical protein
MASLSTALIAHRLASHRPLASTHSAGSFHGSHAGPHGKGRYHSHPLISVNPAHRTRNSVGLTLAFTDGKRPRSTRYTNTHFPTSHPH